MPLRSSVKRGATSPVAAANQVRAKQTGVPAKWHAISIDAKPLSCTLALDLRKKRFLSKEAPALPLEGCTKGSSCPCTYKHHDDRRSKPRRREGAAISSTANKHGAERRNSQGRRSDD
jgi:hypothetical protein